ACVEAGTNGNNPPLDTVAPDTTLTGGPSNPTNSSTASFTFQGTDAGSGIARFECALDTAVMAACGSGVTYTALANGSHTFAVRAVDVAGNVDATPATYTWTVAVGPASILGTISGKSGSTNA